MSEQNWLKSFLSPAGETTQDGQREAGRFEKSNGWEPAPQQPHESYGAYIERINARPTS